MELDDVEVDGESVVKVSKKKPPKVEESKSKKEHVNVVFIGHVGTYYLESHCIVQHCIMIFLFSQMLVNRLLVARLCLLQEW